MARSLVFSNRRRPRVWVLLLLLLLQLLCLEVSLTWALTTKTMANKLNIPNKKSNKDTPTLTQQQQLVTQDKNNNDDDDDPIRHTTHLFSLQWTPDERISKPVRDLWKWKDRVLGDGRDFFVPKPKTIKALQSYLLEHTPSMHSCSIISNCARFEILCSVVATDNNDDDDDSLLHEICRCLVAQQTSKNQNQQPSSMALLTQSLDWPGLVLLDVNTSPRDCGIDKTSEASNELTKHWTHIRGSREISLHLSLIAAGMASRPKRPDRPTVFRPFSSRDAHILLQLKRTKEVAVGKHPQRLLEYALRAGKASRNPQAVPALQLLKPYGTGDSSKYTTEPPLELTQQVQEVRNFCFLECIRCLISQTVTFSFLRFFVLGCHGTSYSTFGRRLYGLVPSRTFLLGDIRISISSGSLDYECVGAQVDSRAIARTYDRVANTRNETKRHLQWR